MIEITKYRLNISRENLSAARFILDSGHCTSSVSCSYFAIFNAIRALLNKQQFECKTFVAVVHHFRREYIKTNIFDKKFSTYFDAAFKLRNNCEYGDFVIVSREEAEEQYQNAVEFVEAVKKYLEEASDENVCEDKGDSELPAADD